MTVLFADAVNSTGLAEKLGEEAMYGLMQDSLGRMTAAVRAYGGHVASFTGDGIMAVFGAPFAQEETGRRAVACALRMQRALADHAEDLLARHAVEFRFRIGMNTGPAVVGTVSDQMRMELTAIGDTVNLASRMQTVAEPGSVYVTESTYREVADHVHCEKVGPLAIKGKELPVVAWRVQGEKPPRTRLERAAERGLAPLVGREEEIRILEDLLEGVRSGRGDTVFVSGDAGVGKSRLLLEFRRRVGKEARWLEGHCTAFGPPTPYRPVVDLLRQTFGATESDDEATVVSRIEEGTVAWAASARATVGFLRYLLSVAPGTDKIDTLTPRERRAGIVDGLRALLGEESARCPLIIAIEDVQWLDHASEYVLDVLADSIPALRCLFIITGRPPDDGWLSRGATTNLALRPLAPDDDAALIRGLLGCDALPAGLHGLVTDRAEGNPFFTEEIVRSLLEAGVVDQTDDDRVSMSSSFQEIHLPGTVGEVVLSRIDRLPASAKAILQLASVIGREFSFPILDRMSDHDPLLGSTLGDLKAADLISETGAPELTYSFKHALTHEVTYATLLTERRRTLHRLVATTMEQLYADRVGEHLEALAHHCVQGLDSDKAIEYLSKAGDKAAATFANDDALDAYAQALQICETSGAHPSIAASLAQRRGLLNFATGRFAQATQDMNCAVAAAHRVPDHHLAGMALSHRGLCEFYHHQLDASEATLQEAIATAARDRDEEVLVTANCYLSVRYTVEGRHAEARPPLAFVRAHPSAVREPLTADFWAFFDSRLLLWEGHPDLALQRSRAWRALTETRRSTWLRCWWNEAHALATSGDYDGARSLLERTLAECERVGDVVTQMRCLNTVGYVLGELHDFDGAQPWNRQSLEMALKTQAPVPEVEMNARLNLAENLLGLDRLDDAATQFRIVEEEVRRPRILWMHWRYAQRLFHDLGEWHLARGQPHQALALADECLVSAEGSNSRKNVVKARRLRGQALLAEDRLEAAESELCGALDVAREVNSPPQLWKTWATLGDLRMVQRRPDQARASYGHALHVVETVANDLHDYPLRKALLTSREVQAIHRGARAGL